MPDIPHLLEVTNLVTGLATLAIAVLVVREIVRFRLGFPRVAVLLIVFFFALVLDRAAAPDPLFGYSRALDAATDVLVFLLLAALVLRARVLALGLLSTMDEARLRAEEYERARHDYSQLVQHRLANPLTAIYGAASTLQRSDLDESVRVQLVATILEGAERIEQLGLGPERQGSEERDLDAVPRSHQPADGQP